MQSLPRNPLLVALTGVVSLTFVFLLARDANTQSTSNKNSQEPDPVVMAVRRGGLREGARLKRVYVSYQRTTGWGKYFIETLASTSAVIIVGKPLSSSSSLTASGENIITEHKIRVERVLKGTPKQGELITVTVPGGKVTFEDGSSAEIQTPDLGPIVAENRYIFFLRTSDDMTDSFGLTGGGQGLFELSSSDSTVKPLGHETDLVQRHKDQEITDFISEIESAVQRYPDTPPCCN